jgi:hypothetical protein
VLLIVPHDFFATPVAGAEPAASKAQAAARQTRIGTIAMRGARGGI